MKNYENTAETENTTLPCILVVDDNPANLQLLTEILGKHGYKVRPAPNAELALKAVQLMLPDVILLDIDMPDMNGYEVCQHLKANEQTRDIPVIFLGALHETTDKVKAFQVGGVDYITKPFQTEEVLARVKTHLNLRNLQKQLQKANQLLEERIQELTQTNSELQKALHTIKTLSGLIPICAWCGRKIRDEEGGWVKLETYIEDRTEAVFSHGMCPDCGKKFLKGE
jgi:PleD family two-component response regulator